MVMCSKYSQMIFEKLFSISIKMLKISFHEKLINPFIL